MGSRSQIPDHRLGRYMQIRSLPKLKLMLTVLSCVSGITALTALSADAGTLANLGVQQATPYDGFVQGLERNQETVSLPIQRASSGDSSVTARTTHFAKPIDGSDAGVNSVPNTAPGEIPSPMLAPIASAPSGDPIREKGEKTDEPVVNGMSYLGSSKAIIKSEPTPVPKRVEIPEPSVVLGLATIVGICAIKRQRYARS